MNGAARPAKAVTAAILRRGASVLLTRRAASEKLAGYWEFPGGKVHEGESPEACLARELREELSLDCAIGAKVAESEYHYAHGAFLIMAYEARPVDAHGVSRENGSSPSDATAGMVLTVHDRAEWVPVARLLEYRLAPADIAIAEAIQRGAR